MCSVNDGSELMPTEPKTDDVTHCKKCGDLSVVVVQIRHAFCRDCFLAMVTHKFRAVLGKSKLMNIKDRVAAVFLGNPMSVALLHLLEAGLSEKSHKRFLFTASVLYIDEGATQDKNTETRQADLKSAASYISSLAFSASYSKIEDVLRDEKENICAPLNTDTELSVNESDVWQLKSILHNATSLSAKQDLLNCLRHKIILRAAKEVNANKVFVELCGTQLAIQIMSDVSLGRGIHLPYNVGFCDARDPDVKILRPMRDLAKNEVEYYNQFMNLEPFIITPTCTKAGPYASIQNLSERFILDLQENFPSTVSTVFRTGEKLAGSNQKPAESGEDNCAMCDAVLDTSAEICSSLEATKFSRTISSLGPKGFDNLEMKPRTSDSANSGDSCACKSNQIQSEKKEGECCSTRKYEVPSEDVILSSLCYGCQLIYRDMKSSEDLPSTVLQAAQERSNLRKMRETLQDFLL